MKHLSKQDIGEFQLKDGVQVKDLSANGLSVSVWDLGGQKVSRDQWVESFLTCSAIVFVVDSTDKSKFKEASCELRRLIEEETLKEQSLLILANKADYEQAEDIDGVR